MPQMAPLSWTSLYIFFTVLLFLLMMFNFYSFMYIPAKSNKKIKTLMTNWKW